MEQRLQNVLVPKERTPFEFTINDTWRREENQFATVFGVEFSKETLLLVFVTRGTEDGFFGELYAVRKSTLGDTTWEAKRIFTVDTWDTTHSLEMGKDDDELFVISHGSSFNSKVSFRVDAGDPIAYIASDFLRRQPWDIKIKLT